MRYKIPIITTITITTTACFSDPIVGEWTLSTSQSEDLCIGYDTVETYEYSNGETYTDGYSGSLCFDFKSMAFIVTDENDVLTGDISDSEGSVIETINDHDNGEIITETETYDIRDDYDYFDAVSFKIDRDEYTMSLLDDDGDEYMELSCTLTEGNSQLNCDLEADGEILDDLFSDDDKDEAIVTGNLVFSKSK